MKNVALKHEKVTLLRPIEVLLVEDDASDVYLLQQALVNACPGEFNVTHVLSIEAALPILDTRRFDVALLDLALPDSSDLEALTCLRAKTLQLPILILTAHNNEQLALSSMQHGAQDYLVKEDSMNGHLIKRAISYAIERKHFEDNLTVLANYDGLTGLVNRSLFESRLDMAMARARRSHEPVAVFFLDLNHFKKVNDTHGHEAGDVLLKEVATRLKQVLRECDTVARFGGDEFAILLEGVEPHRCPIVARKVIDTIGQPFALPDGQVSVGVSIGIAVGMLGTRADALLRHADAAMYSAKDSPDSNYRFYTDHMHQEATDRLQLEQDLLDALKAKRSLSIYYQPKLSMPSGWLAGAEALIRWHHPERGLIMPSVFLPLLPAAAIGAMDRWVLETVCADMKRWELDGMKPLQVSIHISDHAWNSGQVIGSLIAVAKASGLHKKQLAFEVEESAILHHGENGLGVVSLVRDNGLDVHLDNFGSNLSSLKLLTRYPLDAIKIDRSLTAGIDKEERNAVLVQAIIELAQRLGIKIVAEGVETLSQEAALALMSCDQIQGMAIAQPMPADDFAQWVRDRRHIAA